MSLPELKALPELKPPTCWPRPAASAAIFRGDQVLMVRRGAPPRAGLWSLPGGKVEPGERVAEAALREVLEETGITAEIAGLVDVHDVIVRDAAGALTAHYVLSVFYGRWLDGEPAAASDAADARFVPVQGVARLTTTSGAGGFIARAAVLAGVDAGIRDEREAGA